MREVTFIVMLYIKIVIMGHNFPVYAAYSCKDEVSTVEGIY